MGLNAPRVLVAFECPTCAARFTRDKYVALWEGTEEALEKRLRQSLELFDLRCNACNRSIREFVSVWSDDAPKA